MAQEGFQISTAIGNLGGQGFSGYVLGLIYNERGEVEQAIKSFEDAFPITQVGGGLEGNGLSPYGMLAAVYADLGDFHQALEFVHRAVGRASAQLRLQRMWLYALLTRVELTRGNVDAAETAFRDGGVVASIENLGHMFPGGAPLIFFAAAELALAHQEYGHAVEIVDSLLEHLRETRRARVAFPEALYFKAQALRGQRQSDQALVILNEACAEAQAMGSRRNLWKIFAAIGEIEAARGDDAAAQAARAEAHEVIDYIAEHAPAHLRDKFLSLSDVRAILKPESSE
jgi:tetratricopeptide (TPR) repeat protein